MPTGLCGREVLASIAKVYENEENSGSFKDRKHTNTAIAKATGLWHKKQWELGRKNATVGSFLQRASTTITKTNLVDLPLFLYFYFSVKFSLFVVT
jgi:hypothetical protein